MAERVLRWPQVADRLGVSSVTVWRWERDGHFPRRVRLGANAAGWLESEIEAWIAARAAERPQAE